MLIKMQITFYINYLKVHAFIENRTIKIKEAYQIPYRVFLIMYFSVEIWQVNNDYKFMHIFIQMCSKTTKE